MNGYDMMVLMCAAADADIKYISGERQAHADGNGICCVRCALRTEGYDQRELMTGLAAASAAVGQSPAVLGVRTVSPMICEAKDARGYMRYRQDIEVIYEGDL